MRTIAILLIMTMACGCVSMRAPMDVKTTYYDETGRVTQTDNVSFNQVQRALGNAKALQKASSLDVLTDGSVKLKGPGQEDETQMTAAQMQALFSFGMTFFSKVGQMIAAYQGVSAP